MKIAIIGSRNIPSPDLTPYLTSEDEVVSGGAKGVDSCAAEFAKKHNLTLTVFLPEYHRYGRAAPLVRNKKIVDYADIVIAFWDGSSKGTLSVIPYARKINKTCKVILSP